MKKEQICTYDNRGRLLINGKPPKARKGPSALAVNLTHILDTHIMHRDELLEDKEITTMSHMFND